MRILCCGDRNWGLSNLRADEIKIKNALSNYDSSDTTVIHGACGGADAISSTTARNLGMTVESYPADWTGYGRAAGPIRNQQMLDEGKPDLVIAFHSDIENSKGTADMVRRARKANIPIRVVE